MPKYTEQRILPYQQNRFLTWWLMLVVIQIFSHGVWEHACRHVQQLISLPS